MLIEFDGGLGRNVYGYEVLSSVYRDAGSSVDGRNN